MAQVSNSPSALLPGLCVYQLSSASGSIQQLDVSHIGNAGHTDCYQGPAGGLSRCRSTHGEPHANEQQQNQQLLPASRIPTAPAVSGGCAAGGQWVQAGAQHGIVTTSASSAHQAQAQAAAAVGKQQHTYSISVPAAAGVVATLAAVQGAYQRADITVSVPEVAGKQLPQLVYRVCGSTASDLHKLGSRGTGGPQEIPLNNSTAAGSSTVSSIQCNRSGKHHSTKGTVQQLQQRAVQQGRKGLTGGQGVRPGRAAPATKYGQIASAAGAASTSPAKQHSCEGRLATAAAAQDQTTSLMLAASLISPSQTPPGAVCAGPAAAAAGAVGVVARQDVVTASQLLQHMQLPNSVKAMIALPQSPCQQRFRERQRVELYALNKLLAMSEDMRHNQQQRPGNIIASTSSSSSSSSSPSGSACLNQTATVYQGV